MKTDKLKKLNACHEAIDYVKTQKSYIQAWRNCPRGDWMLWIAFKLGVNMRLLTLAKGKCAETVIHLMKDQRSKDAVKTAIDYGNNLITDEELRTTVAAAAAAAAYAADAAAYAAYAAAYAAADVYTAYDANAKIKNQLATANICRKILTKEVLKAYKNYK